MNVIHRSKLKRVEFVFATGDIFDASVDAIVSSEQTDFVLSNNVESLSGRIRRRYAESSNVRLLGVSAALVHRPTDHSAGPVILTSAGSSPSEIEERKKAPRC
jgi:hypothetical protein